MSSIQPKVIAIASGKGGVGKTLLAACLGTIASEDRRKIKVLLADLDFSVKGLTFLYGRANDWKECSGSMIEILNGKKTPEDVLKGVKIINDMTIIPADANFNTKIDRDTYIPDLAKITSSIGEFIESALGHKFNLIIFDTGAGIERPLLALAKHTKNVIIVVEPDEISLTSAFDLLAELKDLVKKPFFVVNKEPDDFDQEKYTDLKEKIEFLPSLPFDQRLHEKFVKNVRTLVKSGFSGTRYKRYVGKIAKTRFGICSKEPNILDYFARKKAAKLLLSFFGYGFLFVITIITIILIIFGFLWW